MAQTPVATTPPALLEGWIQLPTDGAGKQLRAFPVLVYEQQGDGTFTAATAYQQVLALADATGNMIGVKGSPIHTRSNELEAALDQISDTLQEILDVLRRNS